MDLELERSIHRMRSLHVAPWLTVSALIRKPFARGLLALQFTVMEQRRQNNKNNNGAGGGAPPNKEMAR